MHGAKTELRLSMENGALVTFEPVLHTPDFFYYLFLMSRVVCLIEVRKRSTHASGAATCNEQDFCSGSKTSIGFKT
jgi:hypothetical protein